MNVISCVIRMWAPLSIVLSQSTRLTDGRTDGQKGHCVLHYMQSRGKKTRALPT